MNKDIQMKCAMPKKSAQAPMKMTIASKAWAKAKGFCPTKKILPKRED
jgi:hypothetical protein